MRNIIGLIVIVLLFGSCSSNNDSSGGFHVRGVVKNLTAPTISMSELTPKGLILIDTAVVAPDGSFDLHGSIGEKTFCTINLPGGSVVLLVDSASEIILSLDANNTDNYGIKGSPESEDLRKLLQINNGYIKQIRGIESKYASQSQDVPSAQMQDQIRKEYDSIMHNRTLELQSIVLKKSNSLNSYFVTNFLMPESDFAFLEQVDKMLYTKFSNSKYANEHHLRVEKLKRTAIGELAPDIILPDPFGKTIALSSLRGKYVLIDFWASWCRPCREESPNMVKIYNQFKSFGFDILSVSLDDNREAWTKAINDDRLLWNHVSDLKKWNATVVEQYNIESIPFTVLVNKEGKILAKNLRGEELIKKVEEAIKLGL